MCLKTLRTALVGVIEVRKLVRLGKREAGQTKVRPIRFTLSVFEHKT